MILTTVSNFLYRVDYQDLIGLGRWIPLGSDVRASGATLGAEDDLTTNQQCFYRAIRIP